MKRRRKSETPERMAIRGLLAKFMGDGQPHEERMALSFNGERFVLVIRIEPAGKITVADA